MKLHRDATSRQAGELHPAARFHPAAELHQAANSPQAAKLHQAGRSQQAAMHCDSDTELLVPTESNISHSRPSDPCTNRLPPRDSRIVKLLPIESNIDQLRGTIPASPNCCTTCHADDARWGL